jgi:hypothetical protein
MPVEIKDHVKRLEVDGQVIATASPGQTQCSIRSWATGHRPEQHPEILGYGPVIYYRALPSEIQWTCLTRLAPRGWGSRPSDANPGELAGIGGLTDAGIGGLTDHAGHGCTPGKGLRAPAHHLGSCPTASWLDVLGLGSILPR